jgi:hypothetical protein
MVSWGGDIEREGVKGRSNRSEWQDNRRNIHGNQS